MSQAAAEKTQENNRAHNTLPENRLTPGMAIACFFLLIYFILIAYPMFWLIMNSLKTYKEIYKNIWAMPQAPQWMNYVNAWNRGISRYFLNSVLVTGATIGLTIFAAALGSYALARFRFRGNQLVFTLCMGGMMLSMFRSYSVKNYDDEIKMLKEWLLERLKVLDEKLDYQS